MCGKSLGDEAFSTIGEQRKYNYALQPMSKEAFMKLVEVDQPDAPGYFVHDAILNRKERASLEESMAGTMKALSLDEVLELQSNGAQIIDTRDPAEFAGAHLTGSINVGIDGKYATWAGTVLHKEAPIVVIADDDRIAESIMRLGRIGFDHVAGYLSGGMETLRHHEDLIAKTRRITAPAAAELTDNAILDVRSVKEWEAGHIEGSMIIPLNRLEQRIAEVPRDADLVVHCQGGYRSSIATSILQKHGYTNVLDMVGGYKAWVQSKLPVVEATTV
jgi:rhodanese-related sulfurtransferase